MLIWCGISCCLRILFGLNHGGFISMRWSPMVLPYWIEAQWQWFCFTCHMVALDTFEHMWKLRLIDQRLFSFSKCVVISKGWKANSEPVQLAIKALPSTYPKFVGHLSCHSHGPWLISHHRGRILENVTVIPVCTCGFQIRPVSLTQEWKKLEANGFIRIFIQMRDDQVAFTQLWEQWWAVFWHVSKKHRTKKTWNI